MFWCRCTLGSQFGWLVKFGRLLFCWRNCQGGGNLFGAQCLPPLLPQQQWHSETDLFHTVMEQQGALRALQVFRAHRMTFINETDLIHLASVGIRHVRIPISWCLTDASYDDDMWNHYKFHNGNDDAWLLEHFTCPDPYYEDVLWPAIPKSFLEQTLNTCASLNITAILDLHTYPGATSIGTFSGLWPRWSRFWQYDNPTSEKDRGRTILKEVIHWLEHLDPATLAGLRGLSPMNEPAHLSGSLNATLQYVPLLPPDVSNSYQDELTGSAVTPFPNGTHLRILLWLRDAVQAFRESNLPNLGKELNLNIHESIFHPKTWTQPSSLTRVAVIHRQLISLPNGGAPPLLPRSVSRGPSSICTTTTPGNPPVWGRRFLSRKPIIHATISRPVEMPWSDAVGGRICTATILMKPVGLEQG